MGRGKIRRIRSENEVWEVVNRKRKKRKGINEEIRMKEWNEYFRNMLGEVTERVRKEKGERVAYEEEEEEITEEDIGKVIRGLKEGKAMESDGIPNEV